MSILDDIDPTLPPKSRAQELLRRAASIGFEWPDVTNVLGKIHEELGELQDAIHDGNHTHITEEFGDVLFALINIARMLGIDPEAALGSCNEKFERRFRGVERSAAQSGRPIQNINLEELLAYWQAQKSVA